MDAMNGRDHLGKFAKGNPGGPGRPKRVTERTYLAAAIDAVPLEDWQRIVQKAKQDALAGDGKAREWLGKLLLGTAPPSLTDLAAEDEAGLDAVAERVEQLLDDRRFREAMWI